jgi:hypothetical protein
MTDNERSAKEQCTRFVLSSQYVLFAKGGTGPLPCLPLNYAVARFGICFGAVVCREPD